MLFMPDATSFDFACNVKLVPHAYRQVIMTSVVVQADDGASHSEMYLVLLASTLDRSRLVGRISSYMQETHARLKS